MLHITCGAFDGAVSWLRNPQSQASADFVAAKDGRLVELADTVDKAWAEADGNPFWISIEEEGQPGDQLTLQQIEDTAQVLAWLHTRYNVPLQSTDDPNGAGLGWHGMGGAAWGGHTGCPGDPIKAQRPLIIARAQELLGTTTTPGDTEMPKTIIDPKGTITNGMVPNWEVNEKGQVYAWNGARPLNNLDHFTKVAPPIVDVVADPSGNGVIMFGNDKRQDPDGEWRRSTYTILVGM